MPKSFPSWGLDLGYQKSIPTHDPKINPAEHGLRGRRAEGRLSFSRTITRQKARQDAVQGLPASDATTQDQWSERETLILEQAEDVRRGLGTWFSECAASVRNFVHDMTPAELSPEHLPEVIKAGENDLRHFEADDVNDARERHEASIVELRAFREKHGAAIGERTPDIKSNIEQTIAILMLILIIEGAFNALLFKDAQAGGLLGGLLIAFGISAVNVVFGVTAGFFGLRYLNHPDLPFKIMGGVVAAVFITMGVLLNFFIAHFRDAVEVALHAAAADGGSLASFSMFDIAPGAVIASMFPNLVGLDNMVAFGLLFVGMCVFAIAVYEGYDRISDKYPGYGRVWRKERLAYERRQAVRNNLRDDLADYFTKCRNWFETQQTRHAEAKREIEKSLNWLETRRANASAVASRCADQERSLKVAYRQAHRKARNAARDKLGEQAAVPYYFEEIVTPDLPQFDYTEERELANAAVRRIDDNLTALAVTREWLETHVQDVQDQLASIDSERPNRSDGVRTLQKKAVQQQLKKAG
ncbi:MAG: hypothetical protein AAFX08_11620 [Pseudomonadota bacterium]